MQFCLKNIIFLLLLVSCKTTKTLQVNAIKKKSADAIMAQHKRQELQFGTLKARLKIRFERDKQTHNPTVSLRMEKDKKIWLSAKLLGISLAKALITPEKIIFYEKIKKTYYEGKLDKTTNWLGIPLDFNTLQALCIGQNFVATADTYQATVKAQNYILSNWNDHKSIVHTMRLNPDFELVAQKIRQVDAKQQCEVVYKSYQEVDHRRFPKQIELQAKQEDKAVYLQIEFQSIAWDLDLTFPFKIPRGYKKINFLL